jgi:cytochrome P450
MATSDAPIAYPFPPAPSLDQPSPVLAELRAEHPVAEVSTPGGGRAFVVTGFAEVRQVLVDPRFSRALAARPDVQKTALAKLATQSILGMDPPEHTRLRRLVARAFTARRVEELRPRVAKLVDELLTAMRPLPHPVDLVEHFSLPLPVQVICELLGVPAEDRHVFHAWSDALMGGWEQTPEEMQRAFGDLSGYFARLIATKRAQPADDLMTALIAARDEQDKLSEHELVMLGLALLIAGHETTANQINLFLLTLLRHPGQLARLRAAPELIPSAVEELLRYIQLGDGTAAGMPRVTTEEVELGGVRLPAGAVVMASSVAANRDPAAFPDPDRLDLSRDAAAHLAFGAGVHHCLGAPLARMELQEALRGLLRHTPGIRVVIPESELRFKRGMTLRSVEALPVTW